ncbi:arginine--tRNA ligase [Candidatus Falkowbacteria bacterium]|nr:arginine--tRNA ligase [Candidatus Falkowbacteria bacterium]
MSLLIKIKNGLASEINAGLKKQGTVSAADFVFPPNTEMGDLSLPCFGLSKNLKQSPNEVASSLVSKIKVGGFIQGVRTAGPYLNITLNKEEVTKEIFKEISKEKGAFGTNKSGKKQGVMIEYSNANTHKEYHIGHLRNIAYGDAVNRLIAANGFEAIPVSYINDFGIHVAKTLWWLVNPENHENLKNTDVEQLASKGGYLAKAYAGSTTAMADNPDAKDDVSRVMQQIESRKGDMYELWLETRQWSIDQFAKIYEELGVGFKDTFYENEFIAAGMKKVSELYEKHFLTRSEGAIIADLDKFGLNVLMFLRSDGTALYPVADLPLAMAKFEKYKLKKSIYVVDIRQGLYFKQLFKVLELMGYKQEMIHLGYDFVKLPEGMMASRTGNVVTYDDLKQKMVENARKSTEEKHSDWTAEQIETVAKKIALGAMKFEMIKVGRDKTITFELEKAMRFDGYTAAYLQYTYARVQSILRKAATAKAKKALSLGHRKEQELVTKLMKYTEIVILAGEQYEPSEIAKYLFELAQQLNDYYHEVPVLKEEDESIRESRLSLLRSVNQVLANGLGLLGIETIEEM